MFLTRFVRRVTYTPRARALTKLSWAGASAFAASMMATQTAFADDDDDDDEFDPEDDSILQRNLGNPCYSQMVSLMEAIINKKEDEVDDLLSELNECVETE